MFGGERGSEERGSEERQRRVEKVGERERENKIYKGVGGKQTERGTELDRE